MYAAVRRGGGVILQIRTSFNRGGTQISDILGHQGGRGSKNHQKIRTSFMDGPISIWKFIGRVRPKFAVKMRSFLIPALQIKKKE